MKATKNHLLSKSTPTVRESRLLAVLPQSRHDTVIEPAQARAYRRQLPSMFSSALTWLLACARAANTNRLFRRLFRKPGAVFQRIHTYAELREQIHDDLRLQHPDWVQPNGNSPICDSYEARFMELIGPLIGRDVERVQTSAMVWLAGSLQTNKLFKQDRNRCSGVKEMSKKCPSRN